MHRLFAVIGTLLVLSFMFVDSALAGYYIGSTLNVSYSPWGIWAKISVPPSPPNLYGSSNSGQSSWVASLPGNWIQTGWRFYKDWTDPLKYVEYCVDNGTGQCPGSYYHIDNYSFNPTWNTSDEYMTEYDYGLNQWCASFGIPLAHKTCIYFNHYQAVEVQVFTEIHEDARNEVNTHFENIKYKNSGLAWQSLSNNTFYRDNPYSVQIISNDNFWTKRCPDCWVFLASIKK